MLSTDTDNFDTMMETPSALRYVNPSLHSENEKKKAKKNSKKTLGQGACCGSENGGSGCHVF